MLTTADYVQTGIAKEPNWSVAGWSRWVEFGDRGKFCWRNYFQELAREMKRPFVWVDVHRAYLRIQRRRYTEVLSGAFMLTAEKIPQLGSREHPICYNDVSDYRSIWFNDQTRPLLEHWIEDCKTNPEFRKALKLI